MAERSPGARQDRERGGVRLASPAAYDRWFDTGWGCYAFTVEQAAIGRAAGRLDGLRVLDAGCGTGRFTAALERHAARLAGVDLDRAMLAVAACRVQAPLLAADACQLPFRDAAFDVGGPPTDDKPTVTLEPPRDPDHVSSFLNIRVADIHAACQQWGDQGAEFLTPPTERGHELRCYMRDPDGHLIEVGQTTRIPA